MTETKSFYHAGIGPIPDVDLIYTVRSEQRIIRNNAEISVEPYKRVKIHRNLQGLVLKSTVLPFAPWFDMSLDDCQTEVSYF